MGLSRRDAVDVAAGRQDLNDVLKRMAVRDRARHLMERYGFQKALATQVAKGHADLDQVLLGRRLKEYVRDRFERTVFTDFLEAGRPLSLGVHGRSIRRVRMLENGKFEVRFEDLKTGEEESLHKLQVKFAFDPDHWKKVRRALSYDKQVRQLEQEPRPRPQDRYRCSDRRLFHYLEAETPIQVTTLEGERFSGTVRWISQYEFELEVKGRVGIVVLRHALQDVEELG